MLCQVDCFSCSLAAFLCLSALLKYVWSCSKGAAEDGLLILARLVSSAGSDAEETLLEIAETS